MKNSKSSLFPVIATVILVFTVSNDVQSQKLFINEFMASNQISIEDEDGDSSDWLELFNATSESISLSGCYLTDDVDDSIKWQFPDRILEPGGFLIIWASDKDRAGMGELHTNFKISKSGEYLGIYDKNGNVIDSLTFGEQKIDISYGRKYDGGAEWTFFSQPTPGESNIIDGILLPSPRFSKDQGYYDSPIKITLTAPDQIFDVYYTINGDIPTQSSTHYVNEIPIDTTTAIRAICYDDNGHSSQVVTRTYLINESIELPILSLVTDNANLYDEERGIFFNDYKHGSEWERPANISYFKRENGLEFDMNAGIRVHGTATRSSRKKSLRLYFRSEYGQSELNYPVFESKDLTHFKRLILRMGGQDHNMYTAYWTLIRCPLLQRLHSEVQPTFATSRPFMMFLNGKLWGIYYFRERVDKYYLEDNFSVQNADLNKSTWKWGGETIEGDREHWDDTFLFFKSSNLGEAENMAVARQLVDIENFTDHNIFNIFGANWDWPQNNVYKFRDRDTNGPWRWIMWDVDAIFGRSSRAKSPTWNAIEWATRDQVRLDLNYSDTENLLWSTEMLRSLLKSGEYTEYFLTRFADLMNSTLHYNHIIEVIDSLAAVIEPDYELEAERWGVTKESWSNNISSLKTYVEKRHNYMFKHLKAHFNTGRVNQLMISPVPSFGGSVKVNTIHPGTYPWTGLYFNGLPLKLVASPEPGYRFLEWRGDVESTQDSITIYLKSDMNITPVFEVDSAYINVMIHEINYNSSDKVDTEDWVEFYNASNRDIDMGGWIFSDSVDSNRYVFSSNTVIKRSGYLILSRDTTAFRHFFPDVNLLCGNMDFGFSSGGELLRLYDQGGVLVDSVHYDDKLPWPAEADGNGPTLELISPDLDNNLAENWRAGDHYGSPGLPNHTYLEPVPVTLTYFRVDDISADHVTLKWRTESETNNWGFFIERREDGGDFVPVDFIKGKGTTVLPCDYSYTDRDIKSKITIYRLKQVDFDGTIGYSEELQVFMDIPEMPVLHGCYPNPFNNRMMISFMTKTSASAEVILFNVRGEVVRTIQSTIMGAGQHRIEWDGKDEIGDSVSSGVFFVRVTIGEYSMIRKVICLK